MRNCFLIIATNSTTKFPFLLQPNEGNASIRQEGEGVWGFLVMATTRRDALEIRGEVLPLADIGKLC